MRRLLEQLKNFKTYGSTNFQDLHTLFIAPDLKDGRRVNSHKNK